MIKTNSVEIAQSLVQGDLKMDQIFVQSSPSGTYLAMLHRQGVAVWVGASAFNCFVLCTRPQVIIFLPTFSKPVECMSVPSSF